MASSILSRAARWGARLALVGSLGVGALIPIRACDGLVTIWPSVWDVLLRPGTAVALALSFGLLGLLSAGLAGLHDKRALPSTYAVVTTSVLILIVLLSAYHNAANRILMKLEDSERTNEPVVISSEYGGLPTPYTLPGNEGFWGAVLQVQVLRSAQLGYPTIDEEPFAIMYAETVQSSLGAGDLKTAQAASARLMKLAPASPLALITAAKVAYAADDVDQALYLVERGREQIGAESGPDAASLERWFDATLAYYAAVEFARNDAHSDASARLEEYGKLSFDPFTLERVESDPSFSAFAKTEYFENLTRGLADVPSVDRNRPGDSGPSSR